MPHSFADIPHEIRRRVAGGERVALLLLDALGLALLHRHDDHPLVRRLRIMPLRSQLPSTTTAHVTTMHFGVPVEDHGLYEWNILEPTLGEVICPLRFNPAGADGSEGLVGRLDPAALAPGPTFYETLGAPTFVLQPRPIVDSTYTRLATRGASVHGFESLSEGLGMLARVLGDVDGPAVDYLDELWPELPTRLSQPRPAGSSRDVFLHVCEGRVEEVIRELEARFGDRARVAPAASLFDTLGDRLRARLGQVVVLPAPGRQAWLRSASANERWWRGQHGGLEPAETATYLAEVCDPGRIR